ncbi:hypothetical protein KBB12_03040, partial [Candidatus Woesebacteria bacterium]|nr:hypothetical protein [Candidatus Woesebacteria bacterium]
MSKLIALDLASQETFLDSKYALQALLSHGMWDGDASRTRVIDFVSRSVYNVGANSPPQHVSLFFSGRAALKILLHELE